MQDTIFGSGDRGEVPASDDTTEGNGDDDDDMVSPCGMVDKGAESEDDAIDPEDDMPEYELTVVENAARGLDLDSPLLRDLLSDVPVAVERTSGSSKAKKGKGVSSKEEKRELTEADFMM